MEALLCDCAGKPDSSVVSFFEMHARYHIFPSVASATAETTETTEKGPQARTRVRPLSSGSVQFQPSTVTPLSSTQSSLPNLIKMTDDYKVVIIGESGVGKTCLVRKYDTPTLKVKEMQLQPTIGSNYVSKIEEVKPGCMTTAA